MNLLYTISTEVLFNTISYIASISLAIPDHIILSLSMRVVVMSPIIRVCSDSGSSRNKFKSSYITSLVAFRWHMDMYHPSVSCQLLELETTGCNIISIYLYLYSFIL